MKKFYYKDQESNFFWGETPQTSNEFTEITKAEYDKAIVSQKKEPTYIEKRLVEYGTPQEQLEYITEKGLEAWQAKVAEIKKKIPKN
jgi:hypothetical protein